MTTFQTEISHHIWDSKYRLRDEAGEAEASIEATWRRVAQALATVEDDSTHWAGEFYRLLEDFRFLPGGRILAGAGSGHSVTLFNCFVMGPIDDSMDGIFDALREGAITMQAGGGVGYDFSTLRPAGTRAQRTGNVASGPVSFMRIWDATCATLLSTGARRGAMMATLRCDHPDILEFVEAKHDARELRNFNLSVLVSDAFMEAVDKDEAWPLVFPASDIHGDGETLERAWSGSAEPVPCRILRTIRARELWRQIMQSNYDYAEPGVLFIDRINERNNLRYCERINATNPCGEIPLPAYGACNLGAINLTCFVGAPFTPEARLDVEAIAKTTATAVRMLDNVVDVSRFPVPAQGESARRTRRLGLGFTGLADALIMLGLRYDSAAGRELAAQAMKTIREAAYRASAGIAVEKGAFPAYDSQGYHQSADLAGLPKPVRECIQRHGIRNSHLTAIAPCGTISLLANNVSSGIEPVFAPSYQRRVRSVSGSFDECVLEDFALRLWRESHNDKPLPGSFVTTGDLTPEDHLAMQAAVQPCIDSAISKTINVPESISFEEFQFVYRDAYRRGLKGCTCFRPNPVTGAVLSENGVESERQCCTVDREAD